MANDLPGEGARTDAVAATAGWRRRALDHSDAVRRSQERVLSQTERLVDAARSLYRETPRSDFTVQQLAENAGVSLQTFYRYFKSKDDLMFAVYDRSIQESVDGLRSKFGTVVDPVARLRGYTIQGLRRGLKVHAGAFMWNINDERSRLSRIFPAEVAASFGTYEALIAQCIDDGVKSGAMKTELDPATAGTVVATLVAGLYRDVGSTKSGENADRALNAGWIFICAALGIDATAR
jgi:TetR/AcrR family transcriptional regulator